MGVTDATMTHGEAWHFCRLGRSIERADKTSRILDVKYFLLLPSPLDIGTPYDDIQWAALLRSASAFEMYRQRHGRILPARLVDFLVLDREFPRAVLYNLTKANESLHKISGSALGSFSNFPEQILGQLRAELAYTRADEVIEHGLHEFIDGLQRRLNRVGDAVHESFFAPANWNRLSSRGHELPEFCDARDRPGRLQRRKHRVEKNDVAEISNWWPEPLRDSVRELPMNWMDPPLSMLPEPRLRPLHRPSRGF